MSEHIDTRKQIKSIPDLKGFDDLLNRSTLSDLDKTILRMHYIQEKDFRYIGDTLGYAEITMKIHHRKALAKLKKLL